MSVEKWRKKKIEKASDGKAENEQRLKDKGMEKWPDDVERLSIEGLRKVTKEPVEPLDKKPEETKDKLPGNE